MKSVRGLVWGTRPIVNRGFLNVRHSIPVQPGDCAEVQSRRFSPRSSASTWATSLVRDVGDAHGVAAWRERGQRISCRMRSSTSNSPFYFPLNLAPTCHSKYIIDLFSIDYTTSLDLLFQIDCLDLHQNPAAALSFFS